MQTLVLRNASELSCATYARKALPSFERDYFYVAAPSGQFRADRCVLWTRKSVTVNEIGGHKR